MSATVASDWIEHGGGACPVSPETKVMLRYRGPEDLEKGVRLRFARGSRLDWSHDGGPDDIVAFRVMEMNA